MTYDKESYLYEMILSKLQIGDKFVHFYDS